MKDGNCKEMNPNLFYIERGEKILDEVIVACMTCPVREQCEEYSVKHEAYGYWAGLSEKARKNLRAERKITLESPNGDWVNWQAITRQMRAAGFGEKKVKVSTRKVAQCATVSGYMKHRRNKTVICEPCRQANREYSAILRQKKKEREGSKVA